MRVAVLGAGAIGGYVAARLALSGTAVEVLARGAHLDAIRRDGITLVEKGETAVARVHASADVRELQPADVVVLAFKAHQLEPARDAIAAMLRPGVPVVAIQNGIPWWYGDGHALLQGRALRAVDPAGALARLIPTRDVIGGVAYWSTAVEPPGTVRHANGHRLILGSPLGDDARIAPIAAAFTRAGFDVVTTSAIRPEIWLKLFGNVSVNPVSAIGRATVAEIFDQPDAAALVMRIAREALAVATALGDAPPDVDLEQRFARSPRLGAVRTSMLQDVEAARPLELGAIVAAVSELGAIAGVHTPAIDAVLALAALVDRVNRSSRPVRPSTSR